MAIGARDQLFSNKEQLQMNHNKTTVEPTIDGFWDTSQTGYGVVSDFLVTDATWAPLLDMYGVADNTPIPADFSTNCYADGANVDSSRSNYSYHHHLLQYPRSLSSVLGHDIRIPCHIDPQQQINHYLSHNMQRVRFEMEPRLMEDLEERLLKKLQAKEEEKERLVLEERVKSLANENKFLRHLAQTNVATANRNVPGAGLDNVSKNKYDAQSYCGSNSVGKETVRMCRKCGKEELCMLLLPCGHLCLCGGCGFTMHTCPTCESYKEGSIHVNF